jgi:hypothetical protein
VESVHCIAKQLLKSHAAPPGPTAVPTQVLLLPHRSPVAQTWPFGCALMQLQVVASQVSPAAWHDELHCAALHVPPEQA